MTTKNSAYKLSRAVLQHIRELRTITILLAILYIIAGPVPILMYIGNSTYITASAAVSDYLPALVSYFRDDYIRAFYVLALALGFAEGLYITRYQNKRRESDFYHSLPIRREDLLTSRILAVVVVQAVLLALMFMVPPVIALVAPVLQASEFSGLFGLSVAWSASGYLNVMLLFLLTLSMTLFAGQLTGSSFAQVLMLAVFNLTIMGAGFLMEFLLTSCYSTYVTGGFARLLQQMSILQSLVWLYDGQTYSSISQYGHSELLLKPQIYLIWLVLIVVFLVLTYWLYKRRPVEKAGETLIYRWVGTLIKMIYIVLGGFALGGIFGNVILAEFIIGCLAAGVIVHMVAEMIYNQDIYGVKRHLVSTIVATAVALGLSCGMFFHVIDYDHYLPKTSAVQAVMVSDVQSTYGYAMTDIEQVGYSSDKDYIEKVMNLAEKAANAERAEDSQNTVVNSMDGNEAIFYSRLSTPRQDLVDINIGYRTFGGLQTIRRYTISVEDAIQIFGDLNNDPIYQQNLWDAVMSQWNSAESINNLQIYPSGMTDLADTPLNITIWNNNGTINEDAAKRANALCSALEADIVVRDKDVVASRRVATIDLDGYTIPVYEKDGQTAALLAQWREEGFLANEKDVLDKYVADYDWAIIRYDDSDYGYSIDRMLTDKDAIVGYLMNDATYLNQIVSGGVGYDHKYALAYFYKDDDVEDIRDNYYGGFYFIEGHVPSTEQDTQTK